MSGPRVTLPQLPVLIYLLKIIRILKNSYKPFAIIFEEYQVQRCYVRFTQSNQIWFGFATQFVSLTNASILISTGNLLQWLEKIFCDETNQNSKAKTR